MKMIAMPFGVLAVMVAASVVSAQDRGAIQKKLEGEYQLTKTTDDKSDIVTAGSVIVLHKDKVLMVAATTSVNPCMNTYKDGRISPAKACGVGEKIRHVPLLGSKIGADKAPSTRSFVSGEKFWVTKIDVRDNGVIFDFFTDAVNDVRYKASLTIPFPAGLPSADDALKLIHDVITVEPAENADKKEEQPAPGGDKQPAPNQPAPAEKTEAAPPPAEAPPPVEAPPPPPTEVSLGQTPEEVVAALGQPQKKAKVGVKEIYYYKDMKVTFVNGKVKDVQ